MKRIHSQHKLSKKMMDDSFVCQEEGPGCLSDLCDWAVLLLECNSNGLNTYLSFNVS